MAESERSSASATLTSVRLERFKAAFKPAAIALRRFNVIIGRNGSGKSTLLEALQWIDTTLRRDAVEASLRYVGVKDLVNLRSSANAGHFKIGCRWENGREHFTYHLRVDEASDGTPKIVTETLKRRLGNTHKVIVGKPDSSDRLELARLSNGAGGPIRDFWRRAVFLRLSPSSLAEGSLPNRKSFEPILDEHGATLPALLNELDEAQKVELVAMVQEVLPGMRGVEVSKPTSGRSERVHYQLREEMVYRGRAGQKEFPIPAWMLSEGTRRLTALFALLVRKPSPSLLCIEELENGLDPWAVRIVLRHLKDASERGIQVIATTHSPWVLDEVELDDVILVRRKKGDSVYEPFARIPAVRAFTDNIPAGTRYTMLQDEPA